MSDTMLFGVLKMPFEMAMRDEISRIQFYSRVQELVGRFEAQPEQESVAYDKTELNRFVQSLYDEKMQEGKHGHYETVFHVVHQAIKKVAPPAAQRPWVGLTASTILNLMPSSIPADHDGALMEFARAIEAKLKEQP